jgi:SecD/SecF fusion protein
MQNKGFISFIAIVLALACAYHLSFTFVARKVEKDAAAYANGDSRLERAYLDSVANEKVWGLFTYQSAKQREINLGLDLKGGMNLTIEVSVADLLKVMANNSEDPVFTNALRKAREESAKNGSDLITNFVKAAKEADPNVSLASARMFGHKDQNMVNIKMTNDEVVAILRREADQAIERTFEVLNSRIDQFGVTQPNIQKLETTGRILIELPGIKDPERAVELVQKTAKLEFWETYDMRRLIGPMNKMDEVAAKLKKAENRTENQDSSAADSTSVAQADTNATPALSLTDTETADAVQAGDSAKSDSSGMAQQSLEEYKKDHPFLGLIDIAYALDPETEQRTYVEGPVLGYVLTKDTSEFNTYLRLPQIKSLLPKDVKLMWGNKPMEEVPALALYCIFSPRRDGKAPLDGDVITDATFEKNDQGGGFMVRMTMNGDGADKWAKITEANKGKSVAIALDGMIYSAPTVQDKITGGISTITGNFSFEEAKTLAAVLKAGKLPVPATIVEKAVVGPSLGAASIRAGLLSMAIALLVVLIYMAFYYGRAGMTANLALMANVFFLVGTLASLGTTLTLPGIAGIVLTFGMSVDANVLIFERIREELRDGKGMRLAVADGYKMAYSSIIDANVTTILTAIILIIFGAGPVKGFAVVLFAGILTSLFSAIFITRLIFEARLNAKKVLSFSAKITENAFININFDFVGKRKIFYIASSLIILGGVVSFFTKGFNLGVDLKGGRTYTVTFDNSTFSTQDIATALTPALGGEAPIVKLFGANDKVKIITKYKFDDSSPATEEEIVKTLHEGLKRFYTTAPTYEDFANENSGIGLAGSEKVGPSIAGDTKTKSLYAIGFSIVLMFLYIMFRFKGWQFGLASIVALMHDVLIVLACFSIFDGILPFSMEIDQAIIAAVLTVIGYSINDTVVVFDRIREYLTDHKRGSINTLVNNALNSTLSRTINTSLTTLVVLLVIFIFGGAGIRSMSFALLVGIGVGTYSSLMIASPLVVDLKRRTGKDAVPYEAEKI